MANSIHNKINIGKKSQLLQTSFNLGNIDSNLKNQISSIENIYGHDITNLIVNKHGQLTPLIVDSSIGLDDHVFYINDSFRIEYNTKNNVYTLVYNTSVDHDKTKDISYDITIDEDFKIAGSTATTIYINSSTECYALHVEKNVDTGDISIEKRFIEVLVPIPDYPVYTQVELGNSGTPATDNWAVQFIFDADVQLNLPESLDQHRWGVQTRFDADNPQNLINDINNYSPKLFKENYTPEQKPDQKKLKWIIKGSTSQETIILYSSLLSESDYASWKLGDGTASHRRAFFLTDIFPINSKKLTVDDVENLIRLGTLSTPENLNPTLVLERIKNISGKIQKGVSPPTTFNTFDIEIVQREFAVNSNFVGINGRIACFVSDSDTGARKNIALSSLTSEVDFNAGTSPEDALVERINNGNIYRLSPTHNGLLAFTSQGINYITYSKNEANIFYNTQIDSDIIKKVDNIYGGLVASSAIFKNDKNEIRILQPNDNGTVATTAFEHSNKSWLNKPNISNDLNIIYEPYGSGWRMYIYSPSENSVIVGTYCTGDGLEKLPVYAITNVKLDDKFSGVKKVFGIYRTSIMTDIGVINLDGSTELGATTASIAPAMPLSDLESYMKSDNIFTAIYLEWSGKLAINKDKSTIGTIKNITPKKYDSNIITRYEPVLLSEFSTDLIIKSISYGI